MWCKITGLLSRNNPRCVNFFSTNIPVEEEQEQEANGEKPAQEFLFFCPSHFMWKKNEPVL